MGGLLSEKIPWFSKNITYYDWKQCNNTITTTVALICNITCIITTTYLQLLHHTVKKQIFNGLHNVKITTIE